MLQTTKNQLTPEHLMLKKRQLIINKLIEKRYNNIITDINNKNLQYVITSGNSPINIGIDFDTDDNNTETVMMIPTEGFTARVHCEQFTLNDIAAFTKLYIHMLKNNIKEIPDTIENLNNEYLQPGQLAEIISEYLNTED